LWDETAGLVRASKAINNSTGGTSVDNDWDVIDFVNLPSSGASLKIRIEITYENVTDTLYVYRGYLWLSIGIS